jgi:hypothetical protein
MKQLLFLLLFTMLMTGGMAQEVLAPSVFVVTSPMGASLRVDDAPSAEKTPVLVRGLKKGFHRIVVYKDGFLPSTLEVTVINDKAAVLNVALVPDSVVAVFPADPKFEVAGANRSTMGLQFRLPAGRYDLQTRGDTVYAEPVFPDEGLVGLAPWLGVGLGLAAVGSTVFDLTAPTSATNGTTRPKVSMFTPTLWLALAVELGWHWALADREARWQKAKIPVFSPVAQEGAEKAEFAGPLAARAAALLDNGDLSGASALLARLVRDYPDAAEVPGAWFRLARIHALGGERELARGEYRLVAETLQDPEWFDRAHKTLADMAIADGQTEEAVYHLRQMAFADGFFAPSDIQAQIAGLTTAAEGTHAP